MADIVLVLTAGVFFALCVFYVRGCERIVDGGTAAGGAAGTEPRESGVSPS
ncbi:hypothetical protein [Nocardiopsis potens]|uniref:hypothetical protein n=1 Tax=Nocardiopsis potens TaxID=1246458 RepID=UPI00034ACEEE|nr:hypothetical protein [Nocardiopsis potens]